MSTTDITSSRNRFIEIKTKTILCYTIVIVDIKRSTLVDDNIEIKFSSQDIGM